VTLKLLSSDSLKLLFIAAVSCVAAYWLFSDNLSAEFGIIDDHNIIFFLGPDGKLALADIPRLFFASEGGRPFETPRYRPVLFLLFLVESYLWGDSAKLWYLARLVIFASSIAVYWRLFSKKTGLVPSVLFMASLLSFSVWARTFTRLLPSEIYALLAVALFSFGFVRIVGEAKSYTARKCKSVLNWTLVFIGAIAAIGVKENFLFLLLPTFVLFIFAWRSRVLNWLAVLYTALIFAFGALIVASVLFVISRTSADFYDRPVGASFISTLVYPAFSTLLSDKTILLCGMAVCAVFFLASIVAVDVNGHEAGAARKRSFIVFLLFFVGAIALYASQFIFYTGHWPTGTRYDFPGIFAKPLIFFAAIACLVSMSGALRHGGYLKGLALASFSLLMVFYTDFSVFSLIRAEGRRNALETVDFTARLDFVSERLRAEPAANLMLVVEDPKYFEHVISAPRFLRYHGVKNPIYLWVSRHSTEPGESATASGRMRRMEHASKFGTREVSPDGYAFSFFEPRDAINPFEEFKASAGKCYSVSFLGPAEVPGCEDILKGFTLTSFPRS
jgi:hypothetical protein